MYGLRRNLGFVLLVALSAGAALALPEADSQAIERCVARRTQPDPQALLLAKTQALGQLAQRQESLVSGRESAQGTAYQRQAESARVLKLQRPPLVEERYETNAAGQGMVCVRVQVPS